MELSDKHLAVVGGFTIKNEQGVALVAGAGTWSLLLTVFMLKLQQCSMRCMMQSEWIIKRSSWKLMQ
jgi:hypothetical protein